MAEKLLRNAQKRSSQILKKTNKNLLAKDKGIVKDLSKRYNLTSHEISCFKEAFALLDQDKRGTIDAVEFVRALNEFGTECTEAEIKSLLEMQESAGGRIDYPGFLNKMQHRDGDDVKAEEQIAWELVAGVDKTFNSESLRTYFSKLDRSLTDAELEYMVKFIASDGKEVTRNDFSKLFNETQDKYS